MGSLEAKKGKMKKYFSIGEKSIITTWHNYKVVKCIFTSEETGSFNGTALLRQL